MLLSARVSLRDDEVPKLLCEEVVPLSEIPSDEALLKDYKLPGREYKTPRSAYSTYSPASYDTAANTQTDSASGTGSSHTAAAAPAERPSAGSSEPQKKRSRAGVFLKVSSRGGDDCYKASKMCEIFVGELPVFFYYNDEKSYNFNTGITIENNPNLMHGLKKLLGEQNVVVRA